MFFSKISSSRYNIVHSLSFSRGSTLKAKLAGHTVSASVSGSREEKEEALGSNEFGTQWNFLLLFSGKGIESAD